MEADGQSDTSDCRRSDKKDMIIDKLAHKIKQTGNPSVIGLDTALSYLPHSERITSAADAKHAIIDFNAAIIEKIKNIVPAVKVQIAYYEAMGLAGLEAFSETLRLAKRSGMIVIADAKRNDIGETASQYANAFFGAGDFDSDFLTVNGYLGRDGIDPFLGNPEKGIFVLVKTSNKSGGELQDIKTENGETVYERMAQLTSEWGKSSIGKCGYSNVGAVVGATYPEQASALRKLMPHTFFLVPGYGAQGGGASGAVAGFDAQGGGGIVNSSRGIICAYKSEKYKGMDFAAAAYAASVDMAEDLSSALNKR